MRWKPKPWQEDDIQFLLEHPFAGYFADMGAGKTGVILDLVCRTGQTALVIAPKRVAEMQWAQEAEKFQEFSHLRVSRVLGTKQKREAAYREDADIWVMNYENIPWLFNTMVPDLGLPEILVLDESDKMKDSRSVRFRALSKWLEAFSRRIAMTGTPMPNNDPQELFGQIFCIDRGATLGKYITHFRNRFFYQTGYGGYTWEPRPGAREEIWTYLSPIVRRREVPKEREPTVQDIWVELDRDTRKRYKAMEELLLLDLEGDRIDALNAGAKVMKLRQIVQGFVYDERHNAVGLHNLKLEALEEVLEAIGKPTLVVYAFQEEKETLEESGIPVLTGKSASVAEEMVKEWNAGMLPVLGIHPESAGHGLNLQHGGHHMVFLGLDYKPGPYRQVIARLDRQGQKNQVFVHRILAKDTVDETLVEQLESKHAGQAEFLAALKGKYGSA